MKHPQTTAAQMAARLEERARQTALDAEIMRLAAEVYPDVNAGLVTLSTNTVRRHAARTGAPRGTLTDLLAVPMPESADGRMENWWGQASATLWAAMRAARTPAAGRQ